MAAYQCPICDYIYDEAAGAPREGYPAGSSWADVDDNWRCPDCGVREKVDFNPKEAAMTSGFTSDEH